MDIKISAHAAARAAERGITVEGILAILAERPGVVRPSQTDSEADIVYGRYEGNVWGVVFNRNTSNVITVRRAKKIERIVYAQEKGN
jgi:uncharacterized DUF497 family protein